MRWVLRTAAFLGLTIVLVAGLEFAWNLFLSLDHDRMAHHARLGALIPASLPWVAAVVAAGVVFVLPALGRSAMGTVLARFLVALIAWGVADALLILYLSHRYGMAPPTTSLLHPDAHMIVQGLVVYGVGAVIMLLVMLPFARPAR